MWKKIIKITFFLTLILILSGCEKEAVKTEKFNQNILDNKESADSLQSSGQAVDKDAEVKWQVKNPKSTEPEIIEEIEKIEKKPEIKKEISIKTTLNLPVAFAPQAPFANWDMPYQEACEEASIIIVAKYLKNEPLDKHIMDKEILDLVEWEKEYFGYWQDTTTEEVVEILKEYYNIKSHTTAEVTTEKIKEELNKGNLIIVPTAGQLLDNPYFSGEGPVYHMLVIRGYDRNEFITNDPGTKRGEGFKYKYDNLLNAVHDWNGTKENIYQGQKVMVVVEK